MAKPSSRRVRVGARTNERARGLTHTRETQWSMEAEHVSGWYAVIPRIAVKAPVAREW
eukprot:CAMPEP_0197388470 /NCGR_PEP_ID=MMETSP1165-20131217/1098_1 /TAXON_ID=284809 /ORGANISM="Chrysocystis fragilis, Strain CCMP3189" /LENGTH=57 /DNA_ID=CAMNT_0042913817 /DNA_START=26 /DNA_END=196 /DNA_ORIENTATION=+